MSWLSELADNVRVRRMHLGLSQMEVAKRASTIQAQVSNLENGKVQPSLDLLYRIADALGTTIKELLPDTFYRAGKGPGG